jgi:TatD DNase family protein
MPVSPATGTIAYDIRGRRYLNLTSRCNLRCRFCPKFNGRWDVQSYRLKLRGEPDCSQVLEAIGDPDPVQEIVFCGLGEPTLRLHTLLQVSEAMQARGKPVRINTDGLANLHHGRDVIPQLKGRVDALSISLNAQNQALYHEHCRPTHPDSYPALLDFIGRAVEQIPEVTVTAIDGLPGVDIEACADIASRLGARFRRRILDQVG